MTGSVFAIVAICQHFYPPDTTTPKEPTNWVMPSPWLAELMTVFLWPLMIVLPAGLVSQSLVSAPPIEPVLGRACASP